MHRTYRRSAAILLTAILAFAAPLTAHAGVVSKGHRADNGTVSSTSTLPSGGSVSGGTTTTGSDEGTIVTSPVDSSTPASSNVTYSTTTTTESTVSTDSTQSFVSSETSVPGASEASVPGSSEISAPAASETSAPAASEAAASSDSGTVSYGPGMSSVSTSSGTESTPVSTDSGSAVPGSSPATAIESGQTASSEVQTSAPVSSETPAGVPGGSGSVVTSVGTQDGGAVQTASAQVSSGQAATASASSQDVRFPVGLPGSLPLQGTPTSDIMSVIEGAGLNALGTGNTPPDPVLNQVQIANYRMLNQNGEMIAYTNTNVDGNGIFSATGFSKFYMVHEGVARLYYRTYSDRNGWSPWCTSKETTPLNSDGTKVQAIQIRAKGYVHTFNDIYYKVVLNDGTVLDWARNGQTTGTMGSDRYIVAIRVGFWHNTESFPYPTQNLMAGCAYEGAWKDEYGRYHYSSYNGQPYTGWGFIDNQQCYFIDGEPATGWQYIGDYKYYLNSDGSVCTDLEPIMGLPGSYQINYNKATRSFYVMAPDGANGYIIPYKTWNSTCGPDTPIGDFSTYAKYDVKYMHDDVPDAIYCKYLSRFYNGFIIHSILFYGTSLELDAITYNYIDDAASGGCIRLLTGDAFWVYKNCPMGTKVHIYYDQWDKGPVEKGAITQCIPRSQIWDPTDPSSAEAQAALAAAAAQDAASVAAGNGDQELLAAMGASAQ